LSTKTWISFSPPAGISVDISKVVVEPSPVKVLLLATPDKTSAGPFPIYAIYVSLSYNFYTSSKTDIVQSNELDALAETLNASLFVPLPCKTNLLPDITSKDEPEGILAFLII